MPALRIAALIQAGILIGLAGIVLSRAGIALKRWERVSRWMVWVAVAFSALSLVLNLITPSAGEWMLWAPVAFVLLVCSLLVAGRHRQKTVVCQARSLPLRGAPPSLHAAGTGR